MTSDSRAHAIFSEARDRARRAAAPDSWLTEYASDPLRFAREVLGLVHPSSGRTTLWKAQRSILRAVMKHRRVVVAGCRSNGKSYAAGGVLVPFFFVTRPSRVLVLAPTLAQVKDILWSKVATAFAKSARRLPGKMGALRWTIDAEHHVVAIPTRNESRVRGYHAGIQVPADPDADQDDAALAGLVEEQVSGADDLLILVDEPEGVSPAVFAVLRGSMSKPNTYMLMQGNPSLGLDDSHQFVQAFEPDSGWWRIKLSALPEERVIELGGEPDTLRYDETFDHVPEYLLSREWIEGMCKDFEPTDPLFLSDVLGRFSAGSTTSLVCPRHILEAALGVTERPRKLGPRMGCDIGGAVDETVACLMMDGEVVGVEAWRCDREDREAQVTSADRIRALAARWGHELHEAHPDDWEDKPIPGNRISIDDSGLVGVGDILASRGCFVDRVLFGSKEEGIWRDLVGDLAFLNVRAELHWCTRRLLQEGIFRIDRQFQKLWSQLQWTHFERVHDRDGATVKMEPKANVIKRHGRSPDFADALILCARQPSAKVFHSGDALWDASERLRCANRERKHLPGGRILRLGESISQAAARRR